jgi:two-component system response regulator
VIAPPGPQSRTVEILLVEDNPADVVLLREALEASGWQHRLHLVEDGAAALDFLLRRETYGAAPRPDLILLDLNMPRMTGCETLSAIKENPALAGVPVFILSGSLWERRALLALGIPAERYVVKPIDFPGILDAVKRIRSLWRQAVDEAGPRA